MGLLLGLGSIGGNKKKNRIVKNVERNIRNIIIEDALYCVRFSDDSPIISND